MISGIFPEEMKMIHDKEKWNGNEKTLDSRKLENVQNLRGGG
jgi:hypothetical protein